MFKHNRLAAIVMSLMMVMSLIPAMAFAENETVSIEIKNDNIKNGSIEAEVGTTVELQTDIKGVTDKSAYHVHWTAEGSQNKYDVIQYPKKLEITAKEAYETGKSTKLTAYLYEGGTCENNYLIKSDTPVCTDGKDYIAKSTSVLFSAVGGTTTEEFNPLKIKLNGKVIKEDTVVNVNRWDVAELNAIVEGSDYDFEWSKGDGKEVFNYIDASGQEITNDTETVTGKSIKIKGLVDQEGTLNVKALNKKGELKGTAKFTVKVLSDMKYGQQGAIVSGYDDPQTVEIVKIGNKIVTDEDIDGTKGTKNPGETFNNSITNSFDLGKDVNITFFIGKGMSLKKFDKAKFIESALPNISVLNKDGKRIQDLKPIELIDQNIDRSVTIKLPTGQLEEGKYMLLFDKNLVSKSGEQPLGVNVKFWFKVGNPTPVIGDYDVMSQVVINENDFEITPELAVNGIDTNEKVINAMYEAIYDKLGIEANKSNTVVYDVKLQISTDGGETWIDATKDNFPKEGIELELDYPEGTNSEEQDFTVMHMVTAEVNGFEPGEIENLDVTEDKDKLKMTVHSLSPFSITWEDAEAGIVEDDRTVDDENAAGEDSATKTGDNMNIALYAGIMLVALCGGAAVFARRRKER